MNEENRQPARQATDEKSTDPHLPVVRPAESNEGGPKGTEHAKDSQAHHYVSRWARFQESFLRITIAEAGMLLLTLSIAISSVIYTRYAKRQWKVMNDQLPSLQDSAKAAKSAADTAVKQLEMSERPWVRFDVRIIGGLKLQADGAILPLRFALKNIGHSPAINIFPYTSSFPTYGRIDPVKKQKEFCDMIKLLGQKGFEHVIPPLFPEDVPFVQNVTVTINQSDIEKAAPYDMFVPTIVGCVDYHSSFSSEHYQTPFIYQVLWSDPPPANGGLTMGFPVKDVPLKNLRLYNYFSGSGEIH